jgi:hypothetical protein
MVAGGSSLCPLLDYCRHCCQCTVVGLEVCNGCVGTTAADLWFDNNAVVGVLAPSRSVGVVL